MIETNHSKKAATEAPAPAREFEPDREQLTAFAEALNPHATPGTYVSLRSFPNERQGKNKPLSFKVVKLNSGGHDALIEATRDEALRAPSSGRTISTRKINKKKSAIEPHSVHDGSDFIGTLSERAGRYTARSLNGAVIGVFNSITQATRSLPKLVSYSSDVVAMSSEYRAIPEQTR